MATAHDPERLASDDAAIAKWAADLPAIHPMEVRLALQRLFASAAELANGLAQLLAHFSKSETASPLTRQRLKNSSVGAEVYEFMT